MKAIEARNLSDSANYTSHACLMSNIYANVESYAKEGKTFLQFHVNESYKPQLESAMSSLRTDGYIVKYESGSDQRDGESWSYLAISW